MKILGISCYARNSAVALLKDGVVFASAEEAWFTRVSGDRSFPVNALRWCLGFSGMRLSDIDLVVFYEKPFWKFSHIVKSSIAAAPWGCSRFVRGVSVFLNEKLRLSDHMRSLGYRGRVMYVPHTETYAASAFYPSPFDEAAFLVLDANSEWETCAFGTGEGNSLSVVSSLRLHSLEMLTSACAAYTGLKDTTALAELAPYGSPEYADSMLTELISLRNDGSFKLNLDHFTYQKGSWAFTQSVERFLGRPDKKAGAAINTHTAEIAASAQAVVEEIVARMARHVHKVTGKTKLCLVGSSVRNYALNSRIARETPFTEVWVPPAGAEAGTALGSALYAWHSRFNKERKTEVSLSPFLGPEFSEESIESFLKRERIPYERIGYSEIPEIAADSICQGRILGWFNGRMELGTPGLGSRVLLGDPRLPETRQRINRTIKSRENFRQVRALVLEEQAREWFDIRSSSYSGSFNAKIRSSKMLSLSSSPIPGVANSNNYAVIQTLSGDFHQLLFDTVQSFYKKTGLPILAAESFSHQNEPPVCTPEEAYVCFMRSGIDHLMLGPFLLSKPAGWVAKKASVNAFKQSL